MARAISDMSSKTRKFIFFLSILITQTVTVYGADGGHPRWDYHSTGGAFEWCHNYDTCCGTQQSPININTQAVWSEDFPQLNLHGYEAKPKWITMKNNGHTIYIELDYPDSRPHMNGGGFTDNYSLASFHFHWGTDNEQGAEHTVNGLANPVEMHMVHFNSKYGDVVNAIKNNDGLAVLGIFFQVTEEDNPALDEIINGLNDLTFNGDAKKIPTPSFNLQRLFPVSTESFYRYVGSLTTPPCDEIVIWTLFDHTQTISLKQLNAFRSLKSNKKDDKLKNSTLSDNYRPVQKLKGRKIYKRHVSGDNSVLVQFPLLLTAAVSAFSSRLF